MTYDYISPNLEKLDPWAAFPYATPGPVRKMVLAGTTFDDPHSWYMDRRFPFTGFINADEAHILHHFARQFEGKPALEIGCHVGFSSWFLLKAGVELSICDPALQDFDIRKVVKDHLEGFDYTMLGMASPQAVTELAFLRGKFFSFVFIDGNHHAPNPLVDAAAAQHYCAADAAIVFHDVIQKPVYDAVQFLRTFGWSATIYRTSMVMAACWRGNVVPVEHVPDQAIVDLYLPDHLRAAAVPRQR